MSLFPGRNCRALMKITVPHSQYRYRMACGVVVVGASGVGAVDADDAGVDKELRWQPHVPPGREISPTTFPESERHS